MRLLIEHLAAVAPLTAEYVCHERVELAAVGASHTRPVQRDELERALVVVPKEAARVQRILNKMDASTVSVQQGGLASSIAAATASLHAVTTAPVEAVTLRVLRALNGARVAHEKISTQPGIKQVGEHLAIIAGSTIQWRSQILREVRSYKLDGIKAFDVRADGSLLVAYVKKIRKDEYQARVLTIGADGPKGVDHTACRMNVSQVVSAPDGGFYLVGQRGIVAYDALGKERWRKETADWPSALTLDNQGNLHVRLRDEKGRALLVLNDQGAVVARRPVANSVDRSAPILGRDGTTYLMTFSDTIERVAPDGSVTAMTVPAMLHPPVLLSDGRLALVHDKRLSILNADGSPSWSQDLEGTPSPPVQSPDGAIYIQVVTAPPCMAWVESFSPDGKRLERGEPVQSEHDRCHSATLTTDGELVVASNSSMSVYE